MQAHKYPEILDMIKAGKLSPEKILEKRVSLEESIKLLPEMDNFKSSGVTVINSFS